MNQTSRVQRKTDLTIIHPRIHKHTLIWIHGAGEHQDKYIQKLINALGINTDYFKIILPRAPTRFIKFLGTQLTSWFDFYMRGEMRFKVPFEEAFSLKQIKQNYQRILLPLMEKQSAQVKSIGGKFMVAGFSQGCGMTIHSLYTNPELVDAAIGVSGYFFPITQYDPKLNDRLHLIYGKQDYINQWDHTKISYYGRISQKKVRFIEGMGHEVNKDTQQAIGQAVDCILGITAKL